MKIKTKRITFRLDEHLYEFLKEFCKENNIDNISVLIRNIIIYFHLAFLTGEIDKNIYQLRHNFETRDVKIERDVKEILGIKQ